MTAAVLITVIMLATYHAVPSGRRMRGFVATLVLILFGWMLSAAFFVMPVRGMAGDASLASYVLYYLVGFPVLFGVLGWAATMVAGLEASVQGPALFAFLGGSVLSALLMSLAVADVLGTGGAAGRVRSAVDSFEAWSGAPAFWLLGTVAILLPWVTGMGVAALRARAARRGSGSPQGA